jgi:hypothetical protein
MLQPSIGLVAVEFRCGAPQDMKHPAIRVEYPGPLQFNCRDQPVARWGVP